jgi:hypothetical protein
MGLSTVTEDRNAGGEASDSQSARAQLIADPKAIAAAKKWLEESYEVELDAARRSGEAANIDEVEHQKAIAEKYISNAELAGRPKSFDKKPSARSSVKANITRVLQELEKSDPQVPKLLEHLKASLVTEGESYAYRPKLKVKWDL